MEPTTEVGMTDAEAMDYRSEIAEKEWNGEGVDTSMPDVPVETAQELDPEAVSEPAVPEVNISAQPEEQDSIDPALKTILDGINNRLGSLDDMNYRIKQTESRIGSIQNSLHNEIKAAKEAAKVVEKAPDKEQLVEAIKNDAEWDSLKKEYPEWSDVMSGFEKRFSSKSDIPEPQQMPDVAAIRAELETDFSQKLTAAQGDFEIRLVDVSRPNWRNTVNSAEYNNWLPQQPLDVRQRAQSVRAEDAINVLDMFNKTQDQVSQRETPEQIQEKRNARLKRSATSVTTGTKTQKIKSEAKMSDLEFRAKLAAESDKI